MSKECILDPYTILAEVSVTHFSAVDESFQIKASKLPLWAPSAGFISNILDVNCVGELGEITNPRLMAGHRDLGDTLHNYFKYRCSTL